MSNDNPSRTPVAAAVPVPPPAPTTATNIFGATAPPTSAPSPYTLPTNAEAYNSTSSPSFASLTSFLILAFIVLFIIRLWQMHKERQSMLAGNQWIHPARNITADNNGNRTTGTEGFGDGPHHGLSSGNSGLLNFTLKERIELYNKTFDSNGNQLTLKNKHIKTKTSKSISEGGNKNNSSIFLDIELGGKTNDYDDKEYVEQNAEKNNDDDDPSIYVSVESERRLTRHLDDDDYDDSMKDEIMATSTDDTSTSTKSLCLDLDPDHNNKKDKNKGNDKDKKGNDKDKEKQLFSGTCIVCLEEFMKDDVIIWSQDPNCPHIYHKECMVNYLASRAQRSKINSTLNVNDNPCPTCRQNYCTVKDEDIVKLMVQKVAASTSSVVGRTTTSRRLADNNSVITTTTLSLEAVVHSAAATAETEETDNNATTSNTSTMV